MNQTSIKQVFKLSIPMFVELFLQLLVGNVDQIMLSWYSQDAVAAAGNANQIINIAIVVLNTMCIGATILVARYIGADDRKHISPVCSVSAMLVVISGALVTVLLFAFSRPLFGWLEVPAQVLPQTLSYTKVVALGIVVQGLYMLITAVMRSYGLAKETMLVSLAVNVINVAGNALLINGFIGVPAMGAVGAAVSTDISKCIGLAIIIALLIKKTDARIGLKYLRPFPTRLLKKTLYISLPAGGESMSYNLSQMTVMKFVNKLGTTVIATKVYCYMMANAIYLYSAAIAQATQVVTGYLVGRQDLKQVAQRVWQSVGISIGVSLAINLLVYLNVDLIFSLFTTDPAVVELARQVLFVEFFLEVGRAVNITMVRSLTALGDIFFPMSTALVSTWLVAVGLSYYLGIHLGMGLVGIWIGMAVDECLRGVIFTIRFAQGKWRRYAEKAVEY